MKNLKTLTATLVIFFMPFVFAKPAQRNLSKLIHHCVPANAFSAGFNYVQISMDDRADYSMAVEWNRPVGRENVEEAPAEYYDDYSLTGYYSEDLQASLEFYDSSDFRGKRTVFEIQGRDVIVSCKSSKM